MKNLWSVVLVAMLAVAHADADAARLGGGKSMGKQSSNVTQREAATPPAAEPAPAELAGSCDDTQAQWIIGKTPTEKDIEQAKNDSKSDAVRSLKPGDAATMDFNPNRLNIILDEKGAVASVNCG